jgi:DNA repair protein RadC
VHPRELVKQALRSNAAAVIVAHNHPSGDVTPSSADRAVTERLKQALRLVDIRLLDHVIVGGRDIASMAAMGW